MGSWNDVAKLGEYILDQLGRDRRAGDLLVHWVAHYLAEQMCLASSTEDGSAREAARARSASLIAQLWNARGGWPEGWPPRAVQTFVTGVRGASGQIHRDKDQAPLPPWLATVGELDALHHAEQTAWLNAALLEVGIDELQAALDAAPAADSELDDLTDIRWQGDQHELAELWFSDHAEAGEDVTDRQDRTRVVRRVLEDVSTRRKALIDRSLEDSLHGQARVPPSGEAGVTPRRKRRQRRQAQRDGGS